MEELSIKELKDLHLSNFGKNCKRGVKKEDLLRCLKENLTIGNCEFCNHLPKDNVMKEEYAYKKYPNPILLCPLHEQCRKFLTPKNYSNTTNELKEDYRKRSKELNSFCRERKIPFLQNKFLEIFKKLSLRSNLISRDIFMGGEKIYTQQKREYSPSGLDRREYSPSGLDGREYSPSGLDRREYSPCKRIGDYSSEEINFAMSNTERIFSFHLILIHLSILKHFPERIVLITNLSSKNKFRHYFLKMEGSFCEGPHFYGVDKSIPFDEKVEPIFCENSIYLGSIVKKENFPSREEELEMCIKKFDACVNKVIDLYNARFFSYLPGVWDWTLEQNLELLTIENAIECFEDNLIHILLKEVILLHTILIFKTKK